VNGVTPDDLPVSPPRPVVPAANDAACDPVASTPVGRLVAGTPKTHDLRVSVSSWPVGVTDARPEVVVALRRFRLPVPARVHVENGKPVRVTTDRRGLTGGRVESCA